jgi:hypothetical protein
MRCLLLHPEDNPSDPTWTRGLWDRVIDLGIAGSRTYEKWSKIFRCAIEPYPSLDRKDFAALRGMCAFGLGAVVDRFGLDWWDLLSVRWLDQFVRLLLVSKFVASLRNDDEIFVSSAQHAQFIELLAPGRVRRIQTVKRHRRSDMFARLATLTFPQLLDVIGDKYDGSYRLRHLIAPARANCRGDVILLPSAYGNASRAALSLAGALPEIDFILVATRHSAWVRSVPPNTRCFRLASYRVPPLARTEEEQLRAFWVRLLARVDEQPQLARLRKFGCFSFFDDQLREGLAIRDCWLNVFSKEPIAAVLCADERNPYTRIPILLAQERGLPTVACHHGALDGRYLFGAICADRFLAKSRMEWDYLVKVCEAPQERVRTAAFRTPLQSGRSTGSTGKTIVFFSEPYEASNCRAREVYAEVIPPLLRLAREHAGKLVIKLHPFESLRARSSLLQEVLPREDQNVQLVRGPLPAGLIEHTWFTATVSSSAAVDCARQGVPAFLCLWLDRYGFRYGEQFVKFGAAMALRAVEEIEEIPMRVKEFDRDAAQDFSAKLQPDLLREILFPAPVASSISAERIQAEELWA